MLSLSAQEIRLKWINFFKNKNHYFLEPVSLIPENDSSLLFINSGIASIKEYFVGKKPAPSNRIVNCQKVIRTTDIAAIGTTYRHHTFFEMLGNFSINDYFKQEAIKYAYEFLVHELKMDPSKLFITVYEDDQESYEIWVKFLKNHNQIIKCNKDRNFWDMGVGPCGPCTEIFYDRGIKYDVQNIGLKLLIDDIDNERYLEIWNIVFSNFINSGGNYIPSIKKNIDTGAGLERLLTISENVENNFENSLLFPIILEIQKFTNKKYIQNSNQKPELLSLKINSYFQIMADHFRAVVMLINDGINFSNKDRGYILRKLFRKTMVCAKLLNIETCFIAAILDKCIETLQNFYSNLTINKNKIFDLMCVEFQIFLKILNNADKYIEKIISKLNIIDLEVEIFKIVETNGIPIDLIKEILESKNIFISQEKYDKLFQQHQQKSKNQKFKNVFN